MGNQLIVSLQFSCVEMRWFLVKIPHFSYLLITFTLFGSSVSSCVNFRISSISFEFFVFCFIVFFGLLDFFVCISSYSVSLASWFCYFGRHFGFHSVFIRFPFGFPSVFIRFIFIRFPFGFPSVYSRFILVFLLVLICDDLFYDFIQLRVTVTWGSFVSLLRRIYS